MFYMPKRRWTYETCFEEAKKYDSRGDFANNMPRAYTVALQNGWLEDYHWFERQLHAPWTYEDCWNEALKFKTKGEFSMGASSAYIKARKNGWLDDFTWFLSRHEATSRKLRKWTYETCYEEAKKYNTIKDFRANSSVAYSIACKNKWNKDYTWLSSAPGTLASGIRRVWTYEKCFEEAKKYNSRWDFGKKCRGAYTAALEDGWISDYTWFEAKWGKWNHETCYEEAKKYTSRGEFGHKNGSAYSVALKNGWLDEYTWLENVAINMYKDQIDCVYVYEFLEQKAAYIGRTLMERKNDRDKEHVFSHDSVVKFARKHDIAVPPMKLLEVNLTVRQGAEREGYYVNKYKEDGWIVLNKAKTGSLGALGLDKWTKKTCLDEAKKYKTKISFMKGSGSAYNKAREKGWLKDYIWLKEIHKPNNYWTYEKCYEEAQKYATRTELQNAPNRAYEVARKNGWLDDYTWLVVKKHIPWTYETCMEESRKYSSRTQFFHNSNGAYDKARKCGWLDDFFPPTVVTDNQLEIKWEDD